MDQEPSDSLTPRQRDCLRLAWQRLTSKEIALELGISKNTVDGYLAEAVAVLGAKDRREAALMCFGSSPDRVRGDAARVDAPIANPQPEAQPAAAQPLIRLPWRQKGQLGNDLNLTERIAWIPIIAVGLAIGFGMMVTALDVLTRLLGRVWQLPR